MNRRTIIIIIGIVGLIVVAAAGWYLVSPLFIDRTVDEAFPFEVPDPAAMDEMTADEKKALESDLMAAIPEESTVAELSDDEREEVEEKVVAAAATVMSDKMMADPMPAAAEEWLTVASGQFAGTDSVHQGAGTATLLQQGEDRVLRFEDFTVTNGPDLHVILTKNPAPRSSGDVGEDYIDLGSLKGNMGNQNYEIPTDVDLSGYQGVVIYCVPFHVVFATAALS